MERTPPVFVGNMKEFIRDKLIYPEDARKAHIEGEVKLYCPISEDGVPQKPFIMYSSSPLLEREAIRLVSLMRWKWDEREQNRKYWHEYITIDFKL